MKKEVGRSEKKRVGGRGKKRKLKWLLLILIILIGFSAIYITFFYTKKCTDVSCFNKGLVGCKRISYIDDTKDVIWLYKIKGKKGSDCVVSVEFLQAKIGTTDILELEGKTMVCSLPSGKIREPQEDLSLCSGLLKEEMQSLIIKKMHSYVVDNLGKISEELESVV